MSNNNNSQKSDNEKKRKVWRNVNVSAGGGPPQAMTPEDAAKYIQQATVNRGREVKISFGPSRPPAAASSGNSGNSVSFGTLDLQALKETAAAAAVASTKMNKGGKMNKDGLPCSEAEMKALMSMFVEIMGMSMDTEKQKAKKKGKGGKGPVFMFGNSNGIPMPPGGWSEASAETVAAATAGFLANGTSWDAIRRTYVHTDEETDEDDDDYDDDSLPDLDEMREMFQASQQKAAAAAQTSSSDSNTKSIPSKPILPSDWSELEQVALDDDYEKEERARKAAKKREKKQRKKAKQKEEAAQKAAEAAQKKREKSILSWRSRVVSACQSNETNKLDALLQESPLRKAPNSEEGEDVTRSFVVPHLEFLLPNCVAKNRAQLTRGLESRHKLADYILSSDLPMAFIPLRSGRTALHTACCYGDVPFIQLLLQHLSHYQDEENLLPRSYLNMTCDDSGWSPLHYAAVSGSQEVLEILLQAGCDTSTRTDDTHTWRESDGQGITPRELIQCIQKGDYEEVLETHGVALQEMTNTFFPNQSERRAFLKNLERVMKRLLDVEKNGYSAPNVYQEEEDEKDEVISMEDESQKKESASGKKKKKKKKKQRQKLAAQQKAAEEAAKASANTQQIQQNAAASSTEQSQSSVEKDPLVVALMGMGFTDAQINAAVKACGGTNRATADDLVTWILGQDADGNIDDTPPVTSTQNEQPLPPQKQEDIEITPDAVIRAVPPNNIEVEEAASLEKEEAARRIAAKREEQRRRNREWNNREQARQQEAAKAKVTKAMAPPQQPGGPPPASSFASYSSLPTAPNGLHTGIPVGLNAGAIPPGLHASYLVPPNMPAQMKAPPPLHVSTGPVTLPPPMGMPHHDATAPMLQQGHPYLAAGSQFPSLSQVVHPQAVHRQASAPLPSEPKRPSIQHQVSSGGSTYGLHSIGSIGGDDDRTVSSYGSNRGLSVSSNSFVPSMVPAPSAMSSAAPAIPPPGFRSARVPATPSIPQSMQTNLNQPNMNANIIPPMGVPAEANPLGEIRATAKAFVPTSFTPAIPPSSAAGSSMPPLSGAFAADSQGLSSHLGPANAPEKSSAMGMPSVIPTGLLQSGMGGPRGMSSSLMDSKLPSQDRMPSVTPASADSATLSSSSMAGGLEEPTTLAGMPLGFGMEPPPPGSNNTSSLLSSAFSNGPAVGASSIWGGPAASASSSFGGLQGFNEGGVPESNNGNGQNDLNVQIPGWGGSGSGAGANLPTGGQGSIW